MSWAKRRTCKPDMKSGSPRFRWHQAVWLALGAASVWWLLSRFDVRQVGPRLDQLGPWGPVVFCVVYAVATVGLLPGTVLSLAAGAKWGAVEGLIYVIIASNLGANLAFGLGRSLLRPWIVRLIAGRPGLAVVEQAVVAEGWKVVFLLRLSPVVPFNILNYALSLTGVRWREYALATLAGMLPGTVMIVNLGAAIQAAVRPQGRSPLEWALLVGGLAATVAVTVVITKAARRALQKYNPTDLTDPTDP
jgi:uncharacterized membrane protein YdjX (TVP38/TMEM64 family)